MTFLEVLSKVENVDADWKIYADANGVVLSKSARGSDAIAKRLDAFLQSKYADVFPTRDLFESSRSLFNTMKRLKAWPDFEAMVGDLCDFLAAGLSHTHQIKLFHYWSTQLIKFTTSEHFSIPELKLVFLQGIKTMMPTDNSHTNGQAFNWVLQKLNADTESLIRLIMTPMTESKTYKEAKDKLDGKSSEEPSAKKAKTSASTFSQDRDLANLSMTVSIAGKGSSRPVFFLDDVAVMIKAALKDAQVATGAELSPETVQRTKELRVQTEVKHTKRAAWERQPHHHHHQDHNRPFPPVVLPDGVLPLERCSRASPGTRTSANIHVGFCPNEVGCSSSWLRDFGSLGSIKVIDYLHVVCPICNLVWSPGLQKLSCVGCPPRSFDRSRAFAPEPPDPS